MEGIGKVYVYIEYFFIKKNGIYRFNIFPVNSKIKRY